MAYFCDIYNINFGKDEENDDHDKEAFVKSVNFHLAIWTNPQLVEKYKQNYIYFMTWLSLNKYMKILYLIIWNIAR